MARTYPEKTDWKHHKTDVDMELPKKKKKGKTKNHMKKITRKINFKKWINLDWNRTLAADQTKWIDLILDLCSTESANDWRKRSRRTEILYYSNYYIQVTQDASLPHSFSNLDPFCISIFCSYCDFLIFNIDKEFVWKWNSSKICICNIDLVFIYENIIHRYKNG